MIWLVASLFYLYEYFVRVIPSVMEHELQSAFSIGASEVAIAVGMYYFIYSPMQLVVGGLFDYYGGRKLLIPASLLIAVGCFLAMVPAKTPSLLAAGRFLMGFGSAFGFVGVMYLCTVWFRKNQLALLSGLTTGLGMLGAIVGQGPLSKVVDNVGWQQTWILAGILGIIMAGILFLFIPVRPFWEEDKPHEQRGIVQDFFRNLFCVIKNKQVWLVGIVGGILFLPLSVFADLWGVQYIRTVTGSTKAQAATVVAMLYLGWLVGGPIAGWLSDRLQTRKKPLLFSTIGCSCILIFLLSVPSMSLFSLGIWLFLLGVLSSSEVVSFIVGIENAPHFARGSAIAAVNMIVMLLGAFLQPAVGFILDFVTDKQAMLTGATHYTQNDYRLALSILPISMLIGVIICCCMRESYSGHNE